MTIDILLIFIKSIVLHHVGVSQMIKTKEQYNYAVNYNLPLWRIEGPWLNQTIFQNLHGPDFEDLN